MFRRNFEIAANVVLHQLFYILWCFNREVIAQAGGNQDLFYARDCPRLSVQANQRRLIRIQILANPGIDAGRSFTTGLDRAVFTGQAPHIRCWSTQIRDDAGETRGFISNLFDLIEDRRFAATLDNPAFMFCDRTETAAPKTAPHNVHRKPNHLVRWDFGIAVTGMWHPLVRQFKNPINFRCRQRDGWRIKPNPPVAVLLHQWLRI